MSAAPPGRREQTIIDDEHDRTDSSVPDEVQSNPGAADTDENLLNLIRTSLDDDKAADTVVIDLSGKTTLADHMIVATGTSQRHIDAMAGKLLTKLKERGEREIKSEGRGDSGWVLIDAGDVIVHLFRAETRSFYDIERLWSVAPGNAENSASR